MLLEIPYGYCAHVVPPACRVPRHVGVQAVHLAIVPELDLDQAPLVAIMHPKEGEDADEGDLGAIAYHRHNGLFLAQMLGVFRGYGRPAGPYTLTTVQAALSWSDGWGHRDPLLLSASRAVSYGKTWMRHGRAVREWFADDRIGRLEQVRSVVEGWVFVDGILCQRSLGPGWRVTSYDGRPHRQESRVDMEAVAEHTPDEGCYSAVRLQDACNMALRLRREFGLPQGDQPIGHIDIVDASAFPDRAHDDWQAYGAALQRLVSSSAEEVGQWKREAVWAWLELRDMLAGEWPQEPMQWVTELVNAFRHACGTQFTALHHVREFLAVEMRMQMGEASQPSAQQLAQAA